MGQRFLTLQTAKKYGCDLLHRKVVRWTAAATFLVFVMYFIWDIWFMKKLHGISQPIKHDVPPLDVSSTHIMFEIGSGSFITLTPTKPIKENIKIRIILDDPDIVETPMNSFTIEALSTPRNYFIPLHSKHVAGHCTVSFRTSSKLPEFQNIFKLRIHVQVVHYMALGYFSFFIGWLYFICWSVYFYPQIYRNFWRKSVVGLSFDYLALNVTGHLCYMTFNLSMYFNSAVQKEFTKIHPKGLLPVKLNDVLFSVHAVSMNALILIQCYMYERADQKVSTAMKAFMGGIWCTIIGGLMGSIMEKLSWLQYLYYLTYINVGTTPIRNTPQVYMHYVRRSTEGWAIQSVILGLCGGLGSFLQMTVDAFNNDDFDGNLGNPGKLGLSLIGLIYDSIFLCQHCLYLGNSMSLAPNRNRKRKITDNSDEIAVSLPCNSYKATVHTQSSIIKV